MQRILLNLKIAIDSLSHFKLRTTLAVLGISLGAFALTIVADLSGSLILKTKNEINRLGENLLIIKSGSVRAFAGTTRIFRNANTLKEADATATLKYSGSVEAVSSSASKVFPVRHRDMLLPKINVVGVEPNFSHLRNFYPANGIFISDKDNQDRSRVVVIGKKIAEKLFQEGENPIGKYILIWRTPCQVIGIMEEKGADISNVDQDNQIFMPLKTFTTRYISSDVIDTIFIKVKKPQIIDNAKGEITALLKQRHNIRGDKEDDFTVIDMKDVLSLQASTMKMVSILGTISAIISFLIGGIGILSIMTLIVNERKIEIGIRRAIGGRKRDIISQFLAESSLIAILGGTFGVILGFAISLAIFYVSKLPFYISVTGLIISFFASILVGIIAGIYPSRNAIKIEPVYIIRNS